MKFIEKIKDRAKSNLQTIVLPEAMDIRTLQAAEEILRGKIADIILIGKEKEIMDKADGLDISGARIIEPDNFDEMEAYVELFTELRSKKGMTKEKSLEILSENPLYLGVMMVKKGMADGMVAGAANATDRKSTRLNSSHL